MDAKIVPSKISSKGPHPIEAKIFHHIDLKNPHTGAGAGHVARSPHRVPLYAYRHHGYSKRELFLVTKEGVGLTIDQWKTECGCGRAVLYRRTKHNAKKRLKKKNRRWRIYCNSDKN